jgi:Flp pilus assembly protein TadG
MKLPLPQLFRRLVRDTSALALTEMAFALPLVLLLGMTGAEYVNYTTTKMRVGQMALQLADNAARMGEGTVAGPKTISETDINDVFTGIQLQSGSLNIQNLGRVILSDLEQDPKNSGKYQIVWQRCYGAQSSHASLYGKQGDNNLNGIGPTAPTNQQVTAQPGNATMFVEVYYVYKPLFYSKYSIIPTTTFDEIASMAVRDQRDLTQIYNTEKATVASC